MTCVKVCVVLCVFLITVFAAIYLIGFICKVEDMRESLLDRSDAARIVASKNLLDLFGKNESSFFNDLSILYNINSDVMIDESKDVKIHRIDIAFNFQDILTAHLA
jgi:hypothetical protein